jgi:hypothetical protein
MLDPASWLHHAKTLDVGKKAHFDHDCGGGRTLVCGHKATGWDAYCYRCAEKGWVPHPPESLAARIKRINKEKQAEHAAVTAPGLPKPMVTDPQEWPAYARVWLYRAGMSNAAIQEAGFYYHERTRRVVLPVVNDEGQLIYWQARGFDEDRPKYINPEVDKSTITARYVPKRAQGEDLVLTEDILSAWKVGLDTEAWSIMGTSAPSSIIPELQRRASLVFVWLDPDPAGQKGAGKIVRGLRSLGVKAKRIVSTADPKLLSREEIRSIIKECKETM